MLEAHVWYHDDMLARSQKLEARWLKVSVAESDLDCTAHGFFASEVSIEHERSPVVSDLGW